LSNFSSEFRISNVTRTTPPALQRAEPEHNCQLRLRTFR